MIRLNLNFCKINDFDYQQLFYFHVISSCISHARQPPLYPYPTWMVGVTYNRKLSGTILLSLRILTDSWALVVALKDIFTIAGLVKRSERNQMIFIFLFHVCMCRFKYIIFCSFSWLFSTPSSVDCYWCFPIWHVVVTLMASVSPSSSTVTPAICSFSVSSCQVYSKTIVRIDECPSLPFTIFVPCSCTVDWLVP